jgi:hypothetical protein
MPRTTNGGDVSGRDDSVGYTLGSLALPLNVVFFRRLFDSLQGDGSKYPITFRLSRRTAFSFAIFRVAIANGNFCYGGGFE